jgi:rfaE bifunctional protein nucleotidyltransferase chain/domain
MTMTAAASKILPLDVLAERLAGARRDGKRVVMCHGTFDLMHTGHIRHLQTAKREGDLLVVTITADRFVNKGPGRPVFGEDLRAETLAALACVDHVAICDEATAIDALTRLRPDVYVKGSDYRSAADDVTGNIRLEQQAVEAGGGRIHFTDEITFSSSSLINEHFGVFSPATKSYLQGIRERYGSGRILEMIAGLQKLRVLVVGDAIIDQYHYISVLGQVGKGLALAVKYENEEQFAGGAIAVANHVAGFAREVTLMTGLGRLDSHEAFVRSKLLPNVTPQFSYVENAPTVVKRRFVDADLNKLFEVYFSSDAPMPESLEAERCGWLDARLESYDVVIVPDFGNGFIAASMVDVLAARAKFLAVNTQLNSGNRGHHVISRYPRVDFASINEPEVRLAAHNRHDPLETVTEAIGHRINAPEIAITRGLKGVMYLDRRNGQRYEVPALSTKVVDRIGAGDAFLALAGLAAGGGVPAEVTAFIGSVSAALDVQIVGNRESVTAPALLKYITTLLK